MKRTAIYLRVSTDRQAQEGDSIPAQRDALHKFIDSHDDMIFVEEYMDDGVSGTKSDRDELQRMLQDAKDGKIDQILVTKLDRLYRNIRHYLNMQELLDKYHVNWMAIWEPIYDTSTPQGRLIINQMMSIAQFEAENTGQRIRQVNAYKIANGEVVFGNTPPGLSIQDKHLVPNKDAEIVRQMFEHYAFGGNLWQTMTAFSHYGIFPNDKAAFKRVLKNEKYIGKYRDNPTFCTPIIDKDLFDDVQRKLDMNVKVSQKRVYIFSGMIHCSECGTRYSGLFQGKKNGIIYSAKLYRCCRHYRAIQTCGNTKILNEKRLEEYLVSNIKPLLSEYVISAEKSDAPQKDNSDRIAYLNKKLSKLKELFVNDLLTLDEYKRDKEEIETELTALEEDKKKADEHDLSVCKKFLDMDIDAIYADLSLEEKRVFWRSIIKEIWVDAQKNIRVVFL